MNEQSDLALALRYAFLAYPKLPAAEAVYIGIDYSADYKEEVAKKAETERRARFRVIQGGKR